MLAGREVGEAVFDFGYLAYIYVLVYRMYRPSGESRRKDKALGDVPRLLRLSFALLALGDTGHVGFRFLSLMLPGGLEGNHLLVGAGALATAVTITVFYGLLLEVWRLYYGQTRGVIYYALLSLSFLRLGIFLFKQNEWDQVVPPYEWSVIRNAPLMVQGFGIMALTLWSSTLRSRDRRSAGKPPTDFFAHLMRYVFFSFFFYVPVVFFVQQYPALGMLMVPKTLMYLAMARLTVNEYFE